MVFTGVNNLDKPLGFDELQLVAMVQARPYAEPPAEPESESHTNEGFHENDIPRALQQRPEDQTRFDRDKEGISFYYKQIVRLVCRATSLPSKDDDFRAKLEGDELEHAEAFERQADKVRELELQLEGQEHLQGHSIVMTEAGTELSQADAEQPENRQAMGLMEEKIELEAQLAQLNYSSQDWAEERLVPTRQTLNDIMHGVKGKLDMGRSTERVLLSVAGAYQLLWRLREERDALLQDNLIQDSSVRKLLFSFLGLRQAYEAGQGEKTALALFATLAKTHGAAGADVVPDTYQAYYVICAQLFGRWKAAGLLHAPLTNEEFSEMEGTDLSGVYKGAFMHKLKPELAGVSAVLYPDGMPNRWTPEALHVRHVCRLRGPWGRLYVKELSKLRELQALLEAPLPDVEVYKAIVKQRLDEVRERLGALEATLEHVLPSPSSSPRAVPASPTAVPTGAVPETHPTTPATAKEAVRNGWWWRRVLQWLSRLRGSLASKLRKLRERLTGKTFNSSASPQDQAAQPNPAQATATQGIATLRQSLKVAKRELHALGTYVKAERTRQELDDWTVDQLENMGLGREGLLCQTLQTLAKSTWDLQDDVAALQSSIAPTANDKLACMLLRVCYIDVPGFFALARRDKGQCQSLVKTAFKKSFKLRRKGHTDRVTNLRSLSNEEKGLLTCLCAGMDDAQSWLERHISCPSFALSVDSSE